MNPNKNSLISTLRQLWQHTTVRRRRQFFLLLALTIITSMAEVVSLGAVLPFISILTQPEKIFNAAWMRVFVQALNIQTAAGLVIPLTMVFAASALVAGALRLLLLWASFRLSNAMGSDLSVEVYRRTLHQPYGVHLERSSSEIISGITQKVGLATSILISSLTVVTSSFLFISIILTLVFIDPVVAIISAICFGVAYLIIGIITRKKLVNNSRTIAREQTQVVKALQEGLGAIRDVLLDGTQKVYIGIYKGAMLKLQAANGQNSFISQAPRYAMESFGMMLIAAFVLVLSRREGGVAAALPVLAMLALGAQRLLPIMQQLYASWSTVVGSKDPMRDVITLLNQPLPSAADLPEPEPIILKNSIIMQDIHFRYGSRGKWVLNGITLEIPKGARVGLIGSTGSGKSTTLDILMGLMEPSMGKLLVDGLLIGPDQMRSWQKTVAHVPQSIFLADASIAENIALGVPPTEIDHSRIVRACESARIADFVATLPEGYATVVGERGSRLSGGQRQRIGIARALYKRSSVLIFDEATSALDNRTEKEVMAAIEGLSKELTIFIIAHRITTLRTCDFIVELEMGKIRSLETYENLITRREDISE